MPLGDYPPTFDHLCYRFYPFLLGSPIDIGISYSDSISQHNETTLSRARKISKLPLPDRVTYRLFVSLSSLLAIIILRYLAIFPFTTSIHLNTQSLPFWFLNEVAGFVAKLFTPLPLLDIYSLHTSSLTIGTLLNIFFTSNMPTQSIEIPWLPFGIILIVSNGVPFIV